MELKNDNENLKLSKEISKKSKKKINTFINEELRQDIESIIKKYDINTYLEIKEDIISKLIIDFIKLLQKLTND